MTLPNRAIHCHMLFRSAWTVLVCTFKLRAHSCFFWMHCVLIREFTVILFLGLRYFWCLWYTLLWSLWWCMPPPENTFVLPMVSDLQTNEQIVLTALFPCYMIYKHWPVYKLFQHLFSEENHAREETFWTSLTRCPSRELCPASPARSAETYIWRAWRNFCQGIH